MLLQCQTLGCVRLINDMSARGPFVFLLDFFVVAATGKCDRFISSVKDGQSTHHTVIHHTVDELWNCPSTCPRRSCLRLSVITVSALVAR